MAPLPVPLIILVLVFIGIALRQVGNIRFEIWQIMLIGAIAALLTESIPIATAWKAINIDVLLFLFGMFVIGSALEESGYISYLSYRLFRNAPSMDSLVLRILFFMGFASALLMNDTLAILGTPLMLLLAKKHTINPKVLLLTLAFAITTGSVMSPIGNPQNLLISINGNMQNPFVTFFKYLFLPTIVNLLAAYWILKILYSKEFHGRKLQHIHEPLKDKGLARLSQYSLVLVILLAVFKTILSLLHTGFHFNITSIALIGCLPILIFSTKRYKIIKKVDWYTLIFFAAMFVLMKSVWMTGFFQRYAGSVTGSITSLHSVLGLSVILSQLISNVPMVALYLPVLMHAGASSKALATLAAGSTIAGNLLILGAASNIIIIQNAEKKSKDTLTFLEFAKAGIPLTMVNVIVYWFFLKMM